jgi:hypothetical protein
MSRTEERGEAPALAETEQEMNSNDIYADLKRIMDAARMQTPWVEWAQKHPVTLSLSDYAPAETLYVLSPTMITPYQVVANGQTWQKVRALMRGDRLPLPPSDQRIAEMIAWHFARLSEPGEHGFLSDCRS